MSLFPNTDITLFNRVKGKNGYEYYKTYIKGVDWQNKVIVVNTQAGDKGILKKDNTIIFIDNPAGTTKTFLKPKAFNRMENKSKYYTLLAGDKIVKGIVKNDITPDYSITNLENDYDDVITITNITECSEHFEVEGE